MNENKEVKKSFPTNLALGICIGMMLGVAIGCFTQNIGLAMLVGVVVGICLGLAVSTLKDKQ